MADRTLSLPTAGTGASTSAPGASTAPTYDPNAGAGLTQNLQNQFSNSDQYQGILSRYNDAQNATAANTKATGQYISSVVGGNTDYEKQQTATQTTGAVEAQRGFATNVAALTNLQAQGAQRVKQLTDQANQALMANNAQGASALSNLAVQEQESITNARTQFLNQYFSTQQEARSQASFRTPEQTAVISLAGQYPGAGISDGDSLQQAQAKITSSPLYQANLGKAQQDIETAKAQVTASNAAAGFSNAQTQYLPEQVRAQVLQAQASQTSAGAAVIGANAQANLSGAQAQQTRYLTDLYKGGGGAGQTQDVQGLLNGSVTPQSLQAKYASIPNGGLLVSNILSQAQSQGYNLNSGTLTGIGQQKQTELLNSGNIPGLVGLGLTNAFKGGSNALYNATGGNNRTLPGNDYLHPKAGATQQVGATGYKFDGTNWIKQ
jgi:hypothetical protein